MASSRRAAIERTLANAASVLLADEPTSGVDGANRERVIDALRREAADAAVAVMSTHATGRPPPAPTPSSRSTRAG